MNYPGFGFEILPKTPGFSLGKAVSSGLPGPRLGRLSTPHGEILTPNFIFCATRAAVKGVSSHELASLNTQIILANTYHLMIQPGADLIREMGGLHRFMNWPGPMLTDSGGYQIFAMGFESVSKEIKRHTTSAEVKKTLLKVTLEGAWFRSYWDGQKIFLSPEVSIETQRKLGADLIVQLDECTPYHIEKRNTEKSMLMSLAWGRRSLEAFRRSIEDYPLQALYGVIQGGVYPDLRETSISGVMKEDFFGIAIGGSLGKSREEMAEVVNLTSQGIHRESERQGKIAPIHLLGIGMIPDVFHGVRSGIDTFDCVHPTRMARHGWAIIPAGVQEGGNLGGSSRINLNNAAFIRDNIPLDPSISSLPPAIIAGYIPYSRSYVHHLLKVKEINALTILSRHNIFQMNRLMVDIRKGIEENRLDEVEHYWCGHPC